MPLTIIMPDGEPLDGLASMLSDKDRRAIAERVRRDYENDRRAKLGGDQTMSTDDRLTSALYAQEQRDKLDKNGDVVGPGLSGKLDHAEMKRGSPLVDFKATSHADMAKQQGPAFLHGDLTGGPQPRTLPVVAAELQHAQEQAARVKPLREELDRLLGRKSRARKAVAK